VARKIATNTVVGREELLDFIRTRHHAIVITTRADGRPQASPVTWTAEVLDVPEAVEDFVDYYRSISGEHPDWAEYRQAMIDQGKSLLRVTPDRWGPIATGGFPARLALSRYQIGGGPTTTGSHGSLSSPVSRLNIPARQA
jgi:hypothetical protein